MAHSFHVYIDESGDDGMANFRQVGSGGGSSHWLAVGKNTPNAGTFTNKNQLYFYLTRYLIERVSWLCRDKRRSVQEGNGMAKITFSRRGGLSYDGFRDYLEHLKGNHETQIHWPVIDIQAVDAQDHSRLAALQIAD